MSGTPRTDAAIITGNLDEVANDVVGADFARELERENAALRRAHEGLVEVALRVTKNGNGGSVYAQKTIELARLALSQAKEGTK